MMPLLVPAATMEEIRLHTEAAFPEECCGAMLGRDRDDGVREVRLILPAANAKQESRTRRFLIEPKTLLEAEKRARDLGLDVVGIYHSHPNHPSEPSEFDRAHAMPYWSYVIMSCMAGRSATVQSWRLRDDRSQFDEEAINVRDNLDT